MKVDIILYICTLLINIGYLIYCSINQLIKEYLLLIFIVLSYILLIYVTYSSKKIPLIQILIILMVIFCFSCALFSERKEEYPLIIVNLLSVLYILKIIKTNKMWSNYFRDKNPFTPFSSNIEICSICLDNLCKPISTQICNHKFHLKCMEEYKIFNYSNDNDNITCPVCRSII